MNNRFFPFLKSKIERNNVDFSLRKFISAFTLGSAATLLHSENVHFNSKDNDQTPDEEDLTEINGKLRFKDREPDNSTYGYVILRKDKAYKEQFSFPHTIYVVRYDVDLNGTELALPKDSIIRFEGGCLKNGTLVLNDTIIESKKVVLKDISLKGTIGDNVVNVSWVSIQNHSDIQKLLDYCSEINGCLDLSGSTIAINNESDVFVVKRMVDSQNKYLIIRNGTFLVNYNYAFKSYYKVEDHPRSEYINFVNISFKSDINNSYVLKGNDFLRIHFEGCSFDSVGCVNTDKYFQSLYLQGCLITHLNRNFINAKHIYDIHFLNNSLEHSFGCVVFNVDEISSLNVTNNLTESLKMFVKCKHVNGLFISGNYFESLTDGIIEIDSDSSYVSRGINISGNYMHCNPNHSKAKLQNRKDGKWYYIYLGLVKDYVIQGNSFAYVNDSSVKPLYIADQRSYGLFTSYDTTLSETYNGDNSTLNVIRKLDGTENTGAYLNTGFYIPKSSEVSNFSTKGNLFPNTGGITREYMMVVGSQIHNSKERLLMHTKMPGSQEYYPVTYLQAQSHDGKLTKHIKQANMIDDQYSANWEELNLHLPGVYARGTMRYVTGRGLEIWDGNKWVRDDDVPVVKNKFGKSTNRPSLLSDNKGFQFFDLDLGKPIWWSGTNWVDSNGKVV